MTENEKAELGALTLRVFLEKFKDNQPDIIAVILEELMSNPISNIVNRKNEEIIPISSEQEQRGNQISDDSQGGVNSNLQSEGSINVETSSSVGITNTEDHP